VREDHCPVAGSPNGTLFRSITPAIKAPYHSTLCRSPTLAGILAGLESRKRKGDVWRLCGSRSGSARALQDFDLRFLDLFVRRLVDAGDVVSRISGRENQFIELQLQRQRVAVLRRLDQKNHAMRK
jgi:hypothetical protein